MASTPLTLGALSQFSPISNPGGALNTSVPSSLSQLSLPPTTPSINTTGPLAGIGNKIALAPNGSQIANTTAQPTPAPASSPATLSSIYSGGGTPPPVPPAVTTPAPTGATGGTGAALPASYYNADGTLKSPSQVATDIANGLVAAHTGGDVGTLSGEQFASPDGGTTADAQAAAAQINNTANDISTGATDPYNVAGSSGIAYTPEELDAIQKAYAGVYSPALNTALAKVTLKQSEDKAALDQQNTLAQIDEQAKATVAAQANAPYTLGPDEIRYDASGNPIAAGPESAANALLNGGVASLSQYIRQAANGTKYVDLSTVTDPTENAALQNAARNAGIMPVTPDQATKLQAITDTRNNLQQIQNQFATVGNTNGIENALDVGGFGQALAGAFGNTAIGSYNAWRTAAINSIQALAGGSGSGVRINQAEINSAMQNDIPAFTDTVAQGNAKIQVLNNQLNNWENEILNTNTPAPNTAAGTLTTPDGITWTQNADGSYTSSGGGGTSFNTVGNTTASTLSLNRPQRNNNPGDLKSGGIADSLAIGVSPQGDLIFPNSSTGFKAMTADVTAKIYGASKYLPANPTIAQLGSVYAQDPNWAAKVAGILNVPASTPTQDLPISSLVQAIATQEGYYS